MLSPFIIYFGHININFMLSQDAMLMFLEMERRYQNAFRMSRPVPDAMIRYCAILNFFSVVFGFGYFLLGVQGGPKQQIFYHGYIITYLNGIAMYE